MKCNQSFFKQLVAFSLLLLAFGLSILLSQPAADATEQQDEQILSFEERVAYYLELKSRGFLEWLVAKENQLLQMVDAVSAEMDVRAKQGVNINQFGFKSLYGKYEQLNTSFSDELNRILAIYTQLDSLETILAANELDLWQNIEEVKDDLAGAIDSRRLYPIYGYTNKDLAELIDEYSQELDTLIYMYEHLERLEMRPEVQQNDTLRTDITRQKRQLLYILNQWGAPTVPKRLVDEYMAETDTLVNVLSELESLKLQAGGQEEIVQSSIDVTKQEIISSVDEKMLRLAGYEGTIDEYSPSVTDVFETWKRERVADLEARYTEYEVIRQKLIHTGTYRDLDRMLSSEISYALLNYTNKEYLVTEMQLDAILRSYSKFYQGLDPVYFYKSECYFARGFYDAAITNYENLIENYPESQYFTESVFRMMQISRMYGQRTRFYTFYDIMLQNEARANSQELNQAHLLAGHAYAQDKLLQRAYDALNKIPDNSSAYNEAQYLLGVVLLNMNSHDDAVAIFENLAGKSSMPWTDIATARIKNAALVKLGLIAYQRGQFEKASDYFDKISTGYESRDKGILANAWSEMKKGNYKASLDTVNVLLRNYYTSSYTYEALVLAGHCKRILGQQEGALTDYRYVSSAQSVVGVSEKYEEERKRMLTQAKELNRLEKIALDQQDEQLYDDIQRARQTVDESLIGIRYRSDFGEGLLEDYNEETKSVLEQVSALENIVGEARAAGREDLAAKAEHERERLLKILANIESKDIALSSSFYLDHPAISRQTEVDFRRQSYKLILRRLESEQDRLATDIQRLQQLIEGDSMAPFGTRFELEILTRDLMELRSEVSRFRAWMVAQSPEDYETDLDRWADYSGYEMTDISYTSVVERQENMEELAEKIVNIDDVWAQRRADVEKRVKELEAHMKQLQETIEAQQIQLDKREKARYFRTAYFDTTETEYDTRPQFFFNEPDTTQNQFR